MLYYRTINSNIIRRRFFAFLVISVFIYLIYVSIRLRPVVCYFKYKFDDGKTLPNIESDNNLQLHQSHHNIFFHETSCSPDGTVWLSSRQACAVESAGKYLFISLYYSFAKLFSLSKTAFMNPEHQVYVLYTSQVGFRNVTELPIIDAVLSYPNVKFYYLNLTKYAQNTPMNKWMASGKLWNSQYVNSHTSDILRYLSLWKYSGTYLDLDVVMMKPLSTMKPNFAGAESNNFVAAGIINLEGETGHKIADMCVQDLLENFNGNDWVNCLLTLLIIELYKLILNHLL
jgi:lactosylceramide 4-alpha-galactosyltransferase